MTLQGDKLTGKQAQRKMTSHEDELTGRGTHRKTNSQEDELGTTQPQLVFFIKSRGFEKSDRYLNTLFYKNNFCLPKN